ncbi:hypothetical protein HYS48_02305 [Candidatus Woesearchaeota archaeon]|nr:hypothetical protein [Candidatus Woesearchaeota archaeon]
MAVLLGHGKSERKKLAGIRDRFQASMHRDTLLFGIAFIVVLSLIFFFGVGALLDNRLYHTYPITFVDYDHFLLWAMAEAAYDQGHYLYLPSYVTLGFEKMLTHVPPGLAHLTAIMAYTTGLPVYDAMQFLYLFLFVFLAIPFLFLFLENRKEILILSLALLPLLFKKNFIHAIMAAQLPLLLSTLFLFCLILAFYTKGLKTSAIIALLLSAAMISHPSALFFSVLFLFFAECLEWYTKKFSAAYRKETLKFYGMTVFFFLILTSVYITIFTLGSLPNYLTAEHAFTIKSISPSEFNPKFVSMQSFPFSVLLFIGFGIIISLFVPFRHKFVLFFFLLISNLNYFSFLPTLDYRAFQLRFLWPILLAPFFGIGVYFLLERLCRKRWGQKGMLIGSMTPSLLIALLFLYQMTSVKLTEAERGTAITQEQYEAFQWLENNVKESEDILFLFGDGYSLSIIAVKQQRARISAQDIWDLMATNFSNVTISPIVPLQGIEVRAVFKNARIQSIQEAFTERLDQLSRRSICDFDYYVLDRRTKRKGSLDNQTVIHGNSALVPNPVLFNLLFSKRTSEKNVTALTFMNDQVVVLRNKKKGGDCV